MKKNRPATIRFFIKYLDSKLALIILFSLLIGFTISAQVAPKQVNSAATNEPAKQNFTYKILSAPENTFGYDIYDNNRMMVHQPSVPGLPGNKGFYKKADAEKVAKLVINKINQNIMPPTITKHELDSLHIKL